MRKGKGKGKKRGEDMNSLLSQYTWKQRACAPRCFFGRKKQIFHWSWRLPRIFFNLYTARRREDSSSGVRSGNLGKKCRTCYRTFTLAGLWTRPFFRRKNELLSSDSVTTGYRICVQIFFFFSLFLILCLTFFHLCRIPTV